MQIISNSTKKAVKLCKKMHCKNLAIVKIPNFRLFEQPVDKFNKNLIQSKANNTYRIRSRL